MDANRASRRAEGRALASAFAVLATCGLACAPRTFDTTTSFPEEPREIRGGAASPEPARPSPRARAEVAPVVALEAGDVERVVRQYVLAVVREDVAALEELLADGARPLQRTGGRQQLLDAWKGRMRAADGSRSVTPPSARLGEMTVHDHAALDAPSAPARPDPMTTGDLLVRVPMNRSQGDVRFGDVLVLVLRREHGALRIVTQADES